ncbi:MAG: VWA domain-containing protein [Pseudomonadota bacterium]
MPGFADPLLLLLLPLPLVAWFLLRPAEVDGAALLVPEGIGSRFGLTAGKGDSAAARWGPLLLWVLLVLAAAGPRLLVPNPALPVSGRDLVLALDLSGSMVRKDFTLNGQQVSRLDALKHAGTEFVLRRGGDRVALVIFASKAYYATPPTYDVRAVAQAIREAEIGISGRATGISDGLGLALKRLRGSQATSKVVILLSDGVNNSGPVKPRDAARLARDLGVRVHTIAMGPRDLANADGERDAVDAVTLNAIAELSGGTYFRAQTTADLVAVTEAIDRLETNPGDGPTALVHQELWVWPAGLATLLALWLAVAGFRR